MNGEIWVVVERKEDGVRRVCREALGRAAALGGEAVAVVPGGDPDEAAAAVAPYAKRVLAVAHPLLDDGDAETWAAVLAELIAVRRPAAVLGGATARCRGVFARLSARLGCGYAADVTGLDVTPGGRLRAVRPVLGGRAYATLEFRGPTPDLATVRPGAFPAPAAGLAGTVERVTPATGALTARVRFAGRLPLEAGPVDLAEADVIVAGGRGLRGPEGFRLVEDLAAAFGAAVGASRACVDAGWRDHSCQVGKSGRTVSPKLYVALGISGAVHHRMGMDSARTVVAINNDPNAPFFKHADYGIAGDLFELAPALAAEVRKAKGE
ncbi:MAG: electron transfer flavoprotein subunit alpha/FixB family protein [Deltaproteobacteria bacterium]|nr:electron transfer flavoprotein subunit alpha/FixB family protein [Deltaproteobacteria bacterium]